MNATLLPKIWFAYNSLLDPNIPVKEGIPKAKCRVLSASIATVFSVNLSNTFEEMFPDSSSPRIIYEDCKAFFCNNLFTSLEAIDGDKCCTSHPTESSAEQTDLVKLAMHLSKLDLKEANQQLSEACWAIAKNKQVEKKVIDLLSDSTLFEFWQLFIQSAITEVDSNNIRVPVFIDVEEFQQIIYKITENANLVQGNNRKIRNLCEKYGKEAATSTNVAIIEQYANASKRNSNNDSVSANSKNTEPGPGELVDFTSAVNSLSDFVQELNISVDGLRAILSQMSASLNHGLLLKGNVNRIKDVNSKVAGVAWKPSYCELTPRTLTMYADEKKTEKKFMHKLSSSTTVESYTVTDRTKASYRIRVLENNNPVLMLELVDEANRRQWLGTLTQAIWLHCNGIEYPAVVDCRQREEDRRARRCKDSEEKLNLESTLKHHESVLEELEQTNKALKSEKDKIERQYQVLSAEREELLNTQQEWQHKVERAVYEQSLLDKQIEELKEIRERLQMSVQRYKLEKSDEILLREAVVSSPERAAKLESETAEFERIDKQFELYQEQVRNTLLAHEERYKAMVEKLKENGIEYEYQFKTEYDMCMLTMELDKESNENVSKEDSEEDKSNEETVQDQTQHDPL